MGRFCRVHDICKIEKFCPCFMSVLGAKKYLAYSLFICAKCCVVLYCLMCDESIKYQYLLLN